MRISAYADHFQSAYQFESCYKGKNISRGSENSALHIDSVTENVSFPPTPLFFPVMICFW